jgi:hypothetical membrane protein
LSAWLAPVCLIAGFLLGAHAQPDTYHWQRDAISSLASYEAQQRWWMTAGFYGNGVCHLITAHLLRVRTSARALLALGGLGVILVALFPEHQPMHLVSAGIAFGALALWPFFSAQRAAAWAVRPRVAIAAGVGLSLLLAWFLATMMFGVYAFGVAERALAVAEALWPLVALKSTER